MNNLATNFLANNQYDWLKPRGTIPKYVLDRAIQIRSDFLSENAESASDLRFEFYYDNKGTACLQATVTPKGGYTWEKGTWICQWWGGSDGEAAGIKYTKTQKDMDESEIRIEQRRQDPAFAEIERIILQIATEYDYDFMGAYGISVKYRDPNVKKAYCEGYSNVVIEMFQGNQFVDHVEKYTGGDHAWNVIALKDGRKIYADATWYDSNSIDGEGYVIHEPVRNPVNLTFDISEFNSLGGAIDKRTGRPVKVHFDFNDAQKAN
jgi:hypothetical protein